MTTPSRLYNKQASRYVHLGIDPDSPTGTVDYVDFFIAWVGLHSYPNSSTGSDIFSLVLGPGTTSNPSSGATSQGSASVQTIFFSSFPTLSYITFSLVGSDSYEITRYGVDSVGPGSATESLDTHRQFRPGLDYINPCGDVFMGGILVFLQPDPHNYNNLVGIPIPCCSGSPLGIQPSGPRVPEELLLKIRHPNIGVPGPCSCLDGSYVIRWKGGYLWEAISSCFGERVILTVGCITTFDIEGDPTTGFILRIKCGDDPPIFSNLSSGSCTTVDSTLDKPYKHVEVSWGGTIEIVSGTKCCPILGSGSGSAGFNNHYGWGVTIL